MGVAMNVGQRLLRELRDAALVVVELGPDVGSAELERLRQADQALNMKTGKTPWPRGTYLLRAGVQALLDEPLQSERASHLRALLHDICDVVNVAPAPPVHEVKVVAPIVQYKDD